MTGRRSIAAIALALALAVSVGVEQAAAGTSSRAVAGLQTRIGCLSPTLCLLVGATNAGVGDIVDVHHGTPGPVASIVGTRGMYDVSCPNAAGCVALGRASNDVGAPLVPIDAAGVPQRPILLPVPIGVTLTRLACISPHTCELAGVDAFVTPNVLELGSWNGRTLSLHRVVMPRAAAGITTVGGISCVGLACTVVGSSTVPDGWRDGIALSTVRGKPSPVRVLSGDSLYGVGCVSAALCYAGGFTIHRGVLVTLSSGVPKARTPTEADLMDVSCQGGVCFAAGAQTAQTGATHPFEGVLLTLAGGAVHRASVVSTSTGFSAIAALGPKRYAAVGSTANPGSATTIGSLLTTG